jgi:hypothetical protein
MKFGLVAFSALFNFFSRERHREFGYTLSESKETLIKDLVDGMLHIGLLGKLKICVNDLDAIVSCSVIDASDIIVGLITANVLGLAAIMIVGHRLLMANKQSGKPRLLLFAGTASLACGTLSLFDGVLTVLSYGEASTLLISSIPLLFGALAGIVFLLIIHAFAPEQARLKSKPTQTTFGV